MELSAELAMGLDIALNEADFCDLRINERRGEVRLLFVVLSLPEVGPEPDDRRVVLSCRRVSRIVASLRQGGREDYDAAVTGLALSDLPSVVRSFGSQPVYGWRFIDVPATEKSVWREKASLDFSVGQGRGEHSIDLFQQGVGEDRRHLDLRIEFDDLTASDASEAELNLDDLAAGGRRWWAAFDAGDPRTEGHGFSRLPREP